MNNFFGNKKLLKIFWIIVASIVILGMVVFSIAPLL